MVKKIKWTRKLYQLILMLCIRIRPCKKISKSILKVTIGIPTYNQASFIEAAVKSALAQTYPNVEVIVADDCSFDNTAELMESFKNDSRFFYCKNKKNLGRTGNYRHLLNNLASGDWYINMDGDDYFTDPEFIAKAVQLIAQKNNIVAVMADCTLLDELTGKKILYTSHYMNEQQVEGIQFLKDVQLQKAQTTHLTTMYNRQKAIDIHFYNVNILSSDFESLYRLLLHGSIIYLKQTVGVWRLHGNNLVTIKSVNESIQNLVLPGLVSSYASSLGFRLQQWEKGMLQNMISGLLIEAKKDGRLLNTFLQLIKHYPAATLQVLLQFSSVLKHLKPS